MLIGIQDGRKLKGGIEINTFRNCRAIDGHLGIPSLFGVETGDFAFVMIIPAFVWSLSHALDN